ncbi:hypothetical protein [Thalassospira xiamenensis]|nr:hypothetical protein [Thalassospira xiamenensis]KZB51063.1 hypothetical protein AUP41_08130 [Thalassospira xiamenensis]MCK2167773.1 hypothetical protein [Thalassospira xiamenensis]
MSSEEKREMSIELQTLLGLFNVNVALSDKVPKFCDKMTEQKANQIRLEFQRYLNNDWLGEKDFYDATACTARDERAARQFFRDVYAYAFEGGEEPEVPDYWSR